MQAAMNVEFNTDAFLNPEYGSTPLSSSVSTGAPPSAMMQSPFAPVPAAADASVNMDQEGSGYQSQQQHQNDNEDEPQGTRRKRSRDSMEMDNNAMAVVDDDAGGMEQDLIPTPAWQVSIANPSSFTQFVKMINDVIPECFMKVVKTEGFQGIGFEAVDSASICYLLARLACDTNIEQSCNPRQLWSCVNMDWLHTMAECVPMHSQLNIMSVNGMDNLFLSAVEMARNGKHIECEMHTISKDPPTKRMKDLQHAFAIEFGVTDLKDIVATGKTAKADNLAFTILGYKKADDMGGVQEQMFMEISFVSPMGRMVWLFAHSDDAAQQQQVNGGRGGAGKKSTESGNNINDVGPLSVQAAQIDRRLLEEKFSGEYSIKYLFQILKSMQRRSIIIKLDPSAPLFIEYPMGDNLSFVRWLLARRQPDTAQ